MTAMTCSRVTPAFTVRMTITPVVVGETACAWATDEWAMEVAPIRVRVSAKTRLRCDFIVLFSAITASSFVLCDEHRSTRCRGIGLDLDIGVAPDLQVRCKTSFREQLFAIMLMGYEAELHSQAGCARRRGGVPERCPAPQFPPSSRGVRGDPIGYSQAVRALEARIGALLFIRTTRSVGLTEAGERFLSRAKPAFEELIAARDRARELGQRPPRLHRLPAPPAVGPILLEALIAAFCQ